MVSIINLWSMYLPATILAAMKEGPSSPQRQLMKRLKISACERVGRVLKHVTQRQLVRTRRNRNRNRNRRCTERVRRPFRQAFGRIQVLTIISDTHKHCIPLSGSGEAFNPEKVYVANEKLVTESETLSETTDKTCKHTLIIGYTHATEHLFQAWKKKRSCSSKSHDLTQDSVCWISRFIHHFRFTASSSRSPLLHLARQVFTRHPRRHCAQFLEVTHIFQMQSGTMREM